jgi:hypothetical protein
MMAMSMPAWVSDPGSLLLTEDQYDGLPDHVRKMVEVIDGHVIFCQSGTPEHSDVARRLASRLEAAKPAEPCTRVSTDIGVHFVKRKRTDGTFCFRRPDVSVYRCIERGSKLSARDTLMVAEAVSPGCGAIRQSPDPPHETDSRVPAGHGEQFFAGCQEGRRTRAGRGGSGRSGRGVGW